jgi:autotransporter-associated beta strand protein
MATVYFTSYSSTHSKNIMKTMLTATTKVRILAVASGLLASVNISADQITATWLSQVDAAIDNASSWTGGVVPNGPDDIAIIGGPGSGEGFATTAGVSAFLGTIRILDKGTIRATDNVQRSFANVKMEGGEIRAVSDANQNFGLAGDQMELIGSGNTFTASGSGIFTIRHDISGSGSVTKLSPGDLRLQGALTFTGDLKIEAGRVQTWNGANATNTMPNATLDLAGGRYVPITSATEVIVGGLKGTTVLYLNEQVATMTGRVWRVGGNNQSTVFSGNISLDPTRTAGRGQDSAFHKVGTGILTLTGANDYEGPTVVEAGTLLINGSLLNSSVVTVNSGATLGGSGTINGDITVESGGTLAPGNSIGILNVGQLTLGDGANLVFELTSNATAGTTYDQIDGTSLVLEGGTVTVTLSGIGSQSISQGDTFTLFTGSVTNFDSTTFDIINNTDWTGGWELSEGSLILTAIPEFGTYALLAGLFALGLVLIVRQRS